jgi:hypothetical protein
MPSTNPFDDDYDSTNDGAGIGGNSYANDIHHQQQGERQNTKKGKERSAPLHFSSAFSDVETPALAFDRSKESDQSYARHILSPLENAMMSITEDAPIERDRFSPPLHTTAGFSTRDDETDEVSPLLPDDQSKEYHQLDKFSPVSMSRRQELKIPVEIRTSPRGGHSKLHSQGRKSSSSSRRQTTTSLQEPAGVVMTELASGGENSETVHMEYKFILLEDLGTSSSWLILILPYVAFFISVLLEYATPPTGTSNGLFSSGKMENKSAPSVRLDTAMRIVTFVSTIGFAVFWFRKMAIRCRLCCVTNSFDLNEHRDLFWWENPWVLFPERFYIVLLLASLLLVQEPILIIVYFFPSRVSLPALLIASDACRGIGMHGILMVYACLFHGLRYHTAERSRIRAERQRKALQLRRAVKYLEGSSQQYKSVSSPIAVEAYYEEYGDVDGSAFKSHLRLPNDPCSSGCADFLLPKLMLWLVGVASVAVASFCRLHEQTAPVTIQTARSAFDGLISDPSADDVLYMLSSLGEVLTTLAWIFLIVPGAFATGECLKREPFLGTRPAQLAFRVMFAQIALGVSALVVSLALHIAETRTEWSGKNIDVTAFDHLKTISGLIIGGLDDAVSHFPFIGTGVDQGFGRLLCITVEVLIVAFIFLPARAMDSDIEGEGGDDAELRNRMKNKRDKRLVVHLAKDSRTWRVFPCPIQHPDFPDSPLHDNLYQIYKDLRADRNTPGRGLVSIGPYVPVFCAELACWLNEASWQAYYSPAGTSLVDKDDFEGWMRLDVIGLQLEGYVFDEDTNTQAYVATNAEAQVDGDADSIIVIAFRGTSNAKNMRTDLRMRQVPLLDQLAGIGTSAFHIFPDRVEIHDEDGWIWDTQSGQQDGHLENVKWVSCWTDQTPPCAPSHCGASQERQQPSSTTEDVLARGAKNILQATPVARETFPMVHEGFLEAYSRVRKQLFHIFLPVYQRQLAKSVQTASNGDDSSPSKEALTLPKIYVTGHSLGGSLAQLLALDLAVNCEIVLPINGPDASPLSSYQASEPRVQRVTSMIRKSAYSLQAPIGVYTFGQPRLGNRAFSRLYKQRVPHTFRVVNEGDAITTIPNYLCCGGIYKHAGMEVILDENMTGNILVGPTVVETLFRFHKVGANVMAHQMSRYRDCLECSMDPTELMEYYRGRNVSYNELAGDKNYDDRGNTSANRRSSKKMNRHEEIPDWMIAAASRRKR